MLRAMDAQYRRYREPTRGWQSAGEVTAPAATSQRPFQDAVFSTTTKRAPPPGLRATDFAQPVEQEKHQRLKAALKGREDLMLCARNRFNPEEQKYPKNSDSSSSSSSGSSSDESGEEDE